MSSKRWTYNQVTDETEQALRRYAELCRERPDDASRAHVFGCMANGAVALWRSLTMGWQDEGDNARLEALAAAVGKPEKPAPTGEG